MDDILKAASKGWLSLPEEQVIIYKIKVRQWQEEIIDSNAILKELLSCSGWAGIIE